MNLDIVSSRTGSSRRSLSNFETLFKENQADCVAGVFVNYIESLGLLDPTGR